MSNDQEKHIEFLEKENKDLQTKLTTAEKALAKKIPPELRGASLTIIGHPMMIEQVRQNYVLKTQRDDLKKALESICQCAGV